MERLLPDPVPREDESLAGSIPERDREHAAKLRREVEAVLLVDVGDDRGVPGAGHHMASLVQVAANVLEVVQLAVEDRDDVTGLVQHGLVAGLEIDDLEAAMAEDATPERGDAAGVGAAMDERLGHAGDDVRVGRSGGRY